MEEENKIYAYTIATDEGMYDIHPTFVDLLAVLKSPTYKAEEILKYNQIEAHFTNGDSKKVDMNEYIGSRQKELSDKEIQDISKQVMLGIERHNIFVRNQLEESQKNSPVSYSGVFHGFFTAALIPDSEIPWRIQSALQAEKEYFWKI